MADENIGDLTPQTQAPDIPPQNDLTLTDGTSTNIQQDSTQAVDAIDPFGQAAIEFQQGNFQQFMNISQQIFEKQQVLTQTIIPLVEKALIELLGSNASYSQQEFMGSTELNMDVPIINVTLIYRVDPWIGLDVEESMIRQDATYVFNTLKVVPDVQFTKCAIDVSNGTLVVSMII